MRFTRRVEAPKSGKIPLFDKLHDIKAGTPIGGGILIIVLVSILFAVIFPSPHPISKIFSLPFNKKSANSSDAATYCMEELSE